MAEIAHGGLTFRGVRVTCRRLPEAAGSGSFSASAMTTAVPPEWEAKTTEAAQADLDGLECSSYTWQMRH